MPRRATPDPLATRVACRIRALRQEKGLTLTALAGVAELSKGHLSSVERGLVMVDIRTLQRLADGLGVKLYNLLIFPDEDSLQALIDALRHAPPRALKAVQSELARFPANRGKPLPERRIQRRRHIVRQAPKRA